MLKLNKGDLCITLAHMTCYPGIKDMKNTKNFTLVPKDSLLVFLYEEDFIFCGSWVCFYFLYENKVVMVAFGEYSNYKQFFKKL